MLTLPIPSLEGLTTERPIFRHPVLEDWSWWMEAWGHGHATEAIMACKALAQEHTLTSSVISLIDHKNAKRRAVAKRTACITRRTRCITMCRR